VFDVITQVFHVRELPTAGHVDTRSCVTEPICPSGQENVRVCVCVCEEEGAQVEQKLSVVIQGFHVGVSVPIRHIDTRSCVIEPVCPEGHVCVRVCEDKGVHFTAGQELLEGVFALQLPLH